MRPEDLPEDVRAEAEELVRTGAATPEEIREVLIKMDSLATAEMLYVATMERESALRLLTEFIDSQWQSGAVTEPTHRTCTFIREAVADIREKDRSKILTSIRHHVRALIEATAPIERANAALLLACEALAIFDVESRKAQPPRGD